MVIIQNNGTQIIEVAMIEDCGSETICPFYPGEEYHIFDTHAHKPHIIRQLTEN